MSVRPTHSRPAPGACMQTDDIRAWLPHREPMLFVDTAWLDADLQRITTEHRFELAEPYFAGHFPGDPIVPGVVILECLAQAGRLLLNRRAGVVRPGYLAGIELAKFHQVLRPGDTPRFEVSLLPSPSRTIASGTLFQFKGAIYLGHTRCARAHFTLHQSLAPAAAPSPDAIAHP